MIKILIHTDSVLLPSGLAETTRAIFETLLDKYPGQYYLHQLGWFHHAAGRGVTTARWPIVPTRVVNGKPDDRDRYGQLSFPSLVKAVKPHIVFAYGDLWCWDHVLDSAVRNQFKLVLYYTVDGQPYFGHLEPDGSTHWGRLLSRADYLVTLSKWGLDILKDGCPEIKDTPATWLYHPIDPERFRPLPIGAKEEVRRRILGTKYRGQFVVGWVGRNQFRKQNHKLWETLHYLVHGDWIKCNDCGRVTVMEWDHTRRKQKDPQELIKYDKGYDYSHCWYCKSKNIEKGKPYDVLLALHMPKGDPSWNPDLMARIWKVENNVVFTTIHEQHRQLLPNQMHEVYNSFDVMFYPSGGEGFGNPVAEAMACEIPVVFSDYSSHAEFAKYGGLPVRLESMQPELHHGIYRAVIDTGDAVNKLVQLIGNKKQRAELGQRGREYIKQFNKEVMVESWHKIFQEVMQTENNKLYLATA